MLDRERATGDLVSAQRSDRIDPRRANRRTKAAHHRRHEAEPRRGGERHRIARLDAREQRTHAPRPEKRDAHADRHADCREQQTIAEHTPQDAASLLP